MQASGLESFREIVRRIAPYLGDRVEEIKDWDQVKLLSVRINRLRQWYRPGLLCIGDAAHAMSPVGGVGINLAVQDAVAAARLLAAPLRERRVTAHKNFELIFRNPGPAKAPWQLKVAVQIPGIQRVMGRVIGVGVRPEHVKAASAPACRADRVKKIVVGIGAAAAAFAFTLFETRQRPVRTA